MAKTPRKPSRKYHLQLRTYENTPFVSLWIVATEGGFSSGLMHGELLPDLAEEIATVTGLNVVREKSALTIRVPIDKPGCATVAEQKSLFEEAE